MRNRIAALVTAVTIGLGGAVAASSPAQAQVECENLHGVCLYDNDPFQGDWYFLNIPNYITNFCVNLDGTGFNNRANGVTVNGPSSGGLKSSVRLWNRPDCEFRLDPPGKLFSPGLNSTMNNDITSSVRITVEAA